LYLLNLAGYCQAHILRYVVLIHFQVRCELPAPVAWDAERIWSIAIYLRQPVVFLLRDHINMFTDLGKDWASGPPTDYHKFIPIIYGFKLEMHHFEMNLYANDQNIVDKPLIKEENGRLHLPLHDTRSDVADFSFAYSTRAPLENLNDNTFKCIQARVHVHLIYRCCSRFGGQPLITAMEYTCIASKGRGKRF